MNVIDKFINAGVTVKHLTTTKELKSAKSWIMFTNDSNGIIKIKLNKKRKV